MNTAKIIIISVSSMSKSDVFSRYSPAKGLVVFITPAGRGYPVSRPGGCVIRRLPPQKKI